MGQDAVPAASLASWTREAGGHRHSPLRGRADSSAATAHGERRRNPSGSTSSRFAALKSRARRDVPVPGRTVLQPKIPRWHAVRRCAAQVCRRSGRQGRRQSPPGAPDGVLPPLIFEGRSAHTSDAQAPREREHMVSGSSWLFDRSIRKRRVDVDKAARSHTGAASLTGVIPGLDPGIHLGPSAARRWMAGSSPAMT